MRDSILSWNGAGLDRARLPANWRYRLEELERADAWTLKSNARHHLARAIDESLVCVPIACDEFVKMLEMSKDDRSEDWSSRAHANATSIFNGFTIMDRITPGIEALKKLGSGELPIAFSRYLAEVWVLLTRAEEVRQDYYARPGRERLAKTLVDKILPIYAELESVLQRLLADARTAFDLGAIHSESVYV